MSGQSDLSPLVKVWMVMCGLTFLAGAPLSGYFLANLLREARASARWPHVAGKLTAAEIREIDLGLKQRFRTDVAYEYAVDGRLYTGTRIRLSDGDWDDREAAERHLEGLAPGQKVTVYYRPDDPAQSVLRPGARFQDNALLAIPFVLLAMGVGSLAAAFLNRGG
jgi:hypothetical protein